jgi:hypothetical protein
MEEFNLEAFAYKVCSFACRLRERKSDRVQSLCVFYRQLSVCWCICMWRWEKDLSWHTRARTHTHTHNTHTHPHTQPAERSSTHPSATNKPTAVRNRLPPTAAAPKVAIASRAHVSVQYEEEGILLKFLISQTYQLFGLKITGFTTCTHTHTHTHTHTCTPPTPTPTHPHTNTHTHTHTRTHTS